MLTERQKDRNIMKKKDEYLEKGRRKFMKKKGNIVKSKKKEKS